MNSGVLDQLITKKGSSREQNNDFIKLIELERLILAIAFDVSTKSKTDNGMTRLFASELENRLKSFVSPTTEQVKQSLHNAFLTVKSEFKIGKASMLVLAKLPENSELICFHCGDVRLGKLEENNSIAWLTNVHTGANVFGEFFERTMLEDPNRHILTKCLNLQRKFEFDVTPIEEVKGEYLIATDGFWAECSEQDALNILFEDREPNTEDDCSVLKLTFCG